ncbi:hypothetical protein ACHAWF_010505 [Thalassiosira exigua]
MRSYLKQATVICGIFPRGTGFGFAAPRARRSSTLPNLVHNEMAPPKMSPDEAQNEIAAAASTSSARATFPVISKISGIEWTGSCRYVDASLKHVTNLNLSGGVKYDINGTELTLSSFLTFPNGQTRQVVMRGERNEPGDVMTLMPVEESGPIVMKVSEILPDTILINEVEIESGKTVMTSSVSIMQGQRGVELVGASHEVGDGLGESNSAVIEGHQIWRLSGPVTSKGNDIVVL